ncbi:hypothetical protein Elgi_32130 [Paenibacillus elgii]|nr:hypothetical protein Elgi_32130 [Paenibacillus elgii]
MRKKEVAACLNELQKIEDELKRNPLAHPYFNPIPKRFGVTDFLKK